jgi:hypothetical protein
MYNWWNEIYKNGEKKRKYVDTLRKYHIYKLSKDGLCMNNACIDVYNPIFKALEEQIHTHCKRINPATKQS